MPDQAHRNAPSEAAIAVAEYMLANDGTNWTHFSEANRDYFRTSAISRRAREVQRVIDILEIVHRPVAT